MVRWNFSYDPLSALNNCNKLLGMELERRGEHLEGPYYLDGSPHSYRRDKLKVFISRGSVWVTEEGGRCISLTQWLVEFGGASDFKDALKMIKGESQALHWNREVLQRREVKVVYVDSDVLRGARAFPLEKSPLYGWMCGLFPESAVREVWSRYNVTSDGHGGTCFWYVDEKGRICHDKIFWYQADGHRDKLRPMSRKFRVRDGYCGRCFFGAHLLKAGDVPCVVESEKTALLAALAYPERCWVATGGKSKLQEAIGMELYPDLDAVSSWQEHGGKIVEWWEGWDAPHSEKSDIGDKIVSDILCSRKTA